MQRSKHMMAAIKPTEVDIYTLGDEEPDHEEEEGEGLDLGNSGKEDYELYVDELLTSSNLQVAQENFKTSADDQNLSNFQIEAQQEEIMSDFYIKGGIDPFAKAADAPDHNMPLRFFDNDDGFWDGYLSQERERFNKQNYSTGRFNFKH